MALFDQRYTAPVAVGIGFLLYLPLMLIDLASGGLGRGDGFYPWYPLLAMASAAAGVLLGKLQEERGGEPLAGLAGLALLGFALATVLLLYLPA